MSHFSFELQYPTTTKNMDNIVVFVVEWYGTIKILPNGFISIDF